MLICYASLILPTSEAVKDGLQQVFYHSKSMYRYQIHIEMMEIVRDESKNTKNSPKLQQSSSIFGKKEMFYI